jgi:hypothetical protein
MFSTPGSLHKRTGKCDADRPTYIKQLVEEYKSVDTSNEYREQILANLGNFAYDPINYEYFRRFSVLDLFLTNLREFVSTSARETLGSYSKRLSFSIGGICNICLDEKSKEYLLRQNTVSLMLTCLSKLVAVSQNEEEHLETVLNIITARLFLFDVNTGRQISEFSDVNISLSALMSQFCSSRNKRLANLAMVFTEDCLRPFTQTKTS